MIGVTRSSSPAVLKKNAQKWTAAVNAATSPREKKSAMEKYRHREIKNALIAMFHDKCAYCESKISHVSYGHIEHYLPKSGPRGRRDLVFDWTNLLLSCGVCNGAEWKGDKSPTNTEGGPYVNPCNDDPTAHFRFEYDKAAAIASVRGITPRGMKTEEDLGLNRPDLRAHRTQIVKKLLVISQYVDSDSEALSIIEEAKKATSEYAAFARALF